VNDYDSFAEAYSAETEANLVNGYYARPAILNLAGDVAGRRILDAGCGSGPLSAALRDRGAIVTGIDSSPKMLALARQRLGADADLQVADLGNPLPFPDGAFNDVIASLVLHYLEDWEAPLTELRRVLKPGGRLIAAVDHPFAIALLHREQGRTESYFETYNWTGEWTFGGHDALMSFWHRPLHAMTDAFTAAGFRISVISEPPPAPDTPRDLIPPRDRRQASLPELHLLRPGGRLIPTRDVTAVSAAHPGGAAQRILTAAADSWTGSATARRVRSAARGGRPDRVTPGRVRGPVGVGSGRRTWIRDRDTSAPCPAPSPSRPKETSGSSAPAESSTARWSRSSGTARAASRWSSTRSTPVR
ncbi:MAG: methyltransferase domain-containing protein, partial [Blastococcus sp.]